MTGPTHSSRDGSTPGLALYIHWPFCVSKCPYCDFNSHVRAEIDEARWRAALLADLAHEAERTGERRLTSIFFGGGTPSLMPPATAAALIEAAARHWRLDPDIEITLEANPSSVETARFADLARAGVNRLSLGIQSFEDHALRFLGRPHSAREGLAALDAAQARFDRVSFDLIYALPGQGEKDWRAQLAKALDRETGHLSLYQLTIEPGTRFATRAAKGELVPQSPEQEAALYAATRELTEAAGLPAYEISNHARPGEESRHNLAYWRYGDYAGVGPGAHGRRHGLATVRHRKPENWLAAVDRNRHGIRSEDPLDLHDRTVEALLMGLRLREGIDPARFAAATGMPLAEAVDHHAIAWLRALGLLEADRLACTSEGRMLTNAIIEEVVSDPAPPRHAELACPREGGGSPSVGSSVAKQATRSS